MTRTSWLLGLFPFALAACDGGNVVTTTSNVGGQTSNGTTSATGGVGGTGAGGTGGATGGTGGATTGGTGGAAAGGTGGATTSSGGGGTGGVGGMPSMSAFDWVLGSAADDTARGVAVDSAGSAVVLGSYKGNLDVKGTMFTSTLTDIFLAKVDTDGNLMWSKSFGTAQDDRGVGVSINPQGQIFVAGSFGDVGGHWGGDPYPGTGPYFAKLAADGTNLWSKAWILNGMGNWGGIVADPDGSVWVTGVFNGSINFGPGKVNSTGTLDPFIAHLDLNGGLITLTTFAGDVTVRGQAPDGQGGLFLVGTFKGTLDLGSGPLTTTDAAVAESFVAHLQSNGTASWAKKLPGTVQRVASDSAANAVVTGYFSGVADFGSGILTSAGADDLFVVKLTSDGNVPWSKKLGATSGDAGRAVATDAAGNIYVSGFFSGAPDFGSGPLVVGMQRNALVVKLSTDGVVLGAKGFGGDGNEEGLHVAVDSLGFAFVWGELDAAGNYGSGLKTPVGMKDVFLVKVTP